jgi:hypothetical protein
MSLLAKEPAQAAEDAAALRPRRWLTIVDETHEQMGRSDEGAPLRKVAVCAVLANPFVGRYQEDLSLLIDASEELGDDLGRRAAVALGDAVQSYGKGGLVGTAGEQEHINAMLTTVFGEALRRHAGGGKAWIPSMTKRGGSGESVDVPLAHKDALYVRSHYDGMTLRIPDAPQPDELVVIGVYANRGRINARLGGVSANAITGNDGLR